MRKLFNIFSLFFLLLALAGGAYLVQKNQNTQKGATAVETSSSIS